MGSFFKSEKRLGKRMQEGVARRRQASSVDSTASFLFAPPGGSPPATIIAPATIVHRFFALKKDPMPNLINRIFHRAKVLRIFK